MSFKIFRNSKAARRHLPRVLLNIQAVDKRLKPCYLWDSFVAVSKEVRTYLDYLRLSGEITEDLYVIIINDTLFVAHLENLKKHLNELFATNNVTVVDVSKGHQKPFVLSYADKKKIITPILNIVLHYVRETCSKLKNNVGNQSLIIEVLEFTPETCNMTTLFGALLGYPVLYWYDCQKSLEYSGDMHCLSMMPLRVYHVFASAKNCQLTNSSYLTNTSFPNHELFSFSIPELLSKEIKEFIHSWFGKVCSRYEKQNIFSDIQMVSNITSLPTVVM